MTKFLKTLLLSILLIPSLGFSFSITMVGDIGFNKTNKIPIANYVEAYGKQTTWSELTENIGGLFQDDKTLVFGNLETVISEKELESPFKKKKYKFLSHPNGVEHFIRELNFNLLSLSNNHSRDYGKEGVKETLMWMDQFNKDYGIQYHGLGTRSERKKPVIFEHQGKKVAFSATKNPSTVGMSHINSVIKEMAKVKADIKIISMHYGTEKQIELDKGQQELYQRFVDEAGANLVIGHHPHVIRPIEKYKDSLIVYSLGNFLLIGAANMDRKPLGYDYGLVLKTSFDFKEGKAIINQVKAHPIKRLHYKPHELKDIEARQRILFLNRLSISEIGSRAIQFSPSSNFGVWNRTR